MELLKFANLGLRFLLELCLLAAIGYWGFKSEASMIFKIGLGIGLPLLAAVVWGIFLAPSSSRRLEEPWRLILEIILFGLAILALYAVGQRSLAGIFGVVYSINKTLTYLWKQ